MAVNPIHSTENSKYLDTFIDYFSEFAKFSADEEQAVRENTDIRFFEKGRLLLEEGEIARECYFVLEGLVRRYHIADGEEITTEFFTEKQWVDSESFIQQAPADHYFSCVEDSVLVVGNERTADQLLQKFPQFESVARKITEQDFGRQRERMASFISDSPEQRYLKILKNRPGLINRVPQYILASYIGVTPESLSRIRKRILQRNSIDW